MPAKRAWSSGLGNPGAPFLAQAPRANQEEVPKTISHFVKMLHQRGPRVTLKMHWGERTAANFWADACFWTVTKTPGDLSPSCLEVMWKLVYWQLSMRQPGFSKGLSLAQEVDDIILGEGMRLQARSDLLFFFFF